MKKENKANILAVDLGYSSVKCAHYDEYEILHLDKFISCTARVDSPLESDDDSLFQLGENFYVLGTSALKVPRSQQIQLNSWEGLLEIYPVWISFLMKKYGGQDSFTKIAIGLSLAFKDHADELLDSLEKTLMIPKDFFIILPQGLIAKKIYYEYGLNINEQSKKNDTKVQNVLIVDGGFLTLDICNVINGTASSSATIGLKDTGVINISYDIIDHIFKEYGIRISIKEAQVIVDNDGAWKRRGKIYDLSEQVRKYSIKYLVNVLNLLEDKFGEAIDGLDAILIVGGVAYFFKKYLKDITPEIEKHFPVNFLQIPEIESEFYNAYGFLKTAYELV
jgi:hypothetical protein